MTHGRPSENEYAPFYAGYVSRVSETDIEGVLRGQIADIEGVRNRVPPERETYRYAPEKWTVRELFGHLIDAERVFGYRAFCISRGDEASLPGFDEKTYIAHGNYAGRPLADLASEWTAARQSNLRFLECLDETAWHRSGNANGSPVSVRAVAFIMTGHLRHHLAVLSERYGV